MVGGGGDAGAAAGSAGDGDGKAGDTLVLLDTMLVSSYMQCSPPRHSALVRCCRRRDEVARAGPIGSLSRTVLRKNAKQQSVDAQHWFRGGRQNGSVV